MFLDYINESAYKLGQKIIAKIYIIKKSEEIQKNLWISFTSGIFYYIIFERLKKNVAMKS